MSALRTEKVLKKTEVALTSSLHLGFAAQDQPEEIVGHALIISLIGRAVRLGLLEVTNQKRTVRKHDVVLVLQNLHTVVPPLSGDGWNSLHLTV